MFRERYRSQREFQPGERASIRPSGMSVRPDIPDPTRSAPRCRHGRPPRSRKFLTACDNPVGTTIPVSALDVVFNNLAVRRGGRLDAPQGPDRVSGAFVDRLRDADADAHTRGWGHQPALLLLQDRPWPGA